jgi:hypothetical protein
MNTTKKPMTLLQIIDTSNEPDILGKMVIIETEYKGFIIEIVSHPSLREYYEVFDPKGAYHGICKTKSEAKKRIDEIQRNQETQRP